MQKDDRDILDVLKFELRFLEDGGYGRSVRTPWKPALTFEDSPTCLNFGDPMRSRPCVDCLLMRFVPRERRLASAPCRFIRLNDAGQTIHALYRWGTQEELEEALGSWLRRTIKELDEERRL
ncbi:MAG TPA: hypothetical protein VGK99_09355 [Acidobacteriota bacterium]|jgi:hypothetical protein